MTTYVTDGTVGPWAREKLECLGKYLHAYTTILRKQDWCKGFVYVDAFAGAGKAPLRQYDAIQVENPLLDVAGYIGEEEAETEIYIHGSPRVALNIQHPFTEYVFIEKSPKRVGELAEIQREYVDRRSITILEGDANEQIRSHLLSSGKYNWKEYRAVAFLDPFGMQVPWKTIEDIGKTKAVEIILNLPVGMAIQRLLPKSGHFSDEQKKKLTEYFGSSDWESIVYEEKQDLFGLLKTKKADAGQQLAKWYQKRLKEAYGHSSKPRLIKNPRGTHLYYLLWAGPNPTGKKIAEDVLKQGEVV
jgi:three-Cys-motif partner protein